MTTAILFANAPDITSDDYCVFGLATCFLKEDGEIRRVQIVEPIPSAALEALLKGIPTSYQLISAKSIGEVVVDNTHKMLVEFPNDAHFCEDFAERAVAAVRTYKRRLEAKEHLPLGTLKKDLNFSVEKKRILNTVNVVGTEDNVKQHTHTNQVF